jgi:cell division protein FtsQ
VKKTLFKLILFFITAIGLTVSGYFLSKSSIFNLEKINYSYALETSYIEFLKPQIESKMETRVGKSIWDLDIFDIEKDLEKLPWVQNIVISRQFPNELFVEIEPKKIIANIMKTPSKVQPVAYDSSVLTEVEITKAPLAPILSGSAFSKSDDLRKKALDLLRELPVEGTFSYGAVSEVFPFKNDEFQLLLKKSKALVLINTENVPLKAARISKVIDYMDPNEMKGRVIDSNFSKKVLVRPRNHR